VDGKKEACDGLVTIAYKQFGTRGRIALQAISSALFVEL
jgi:hypothetical protein